MSKFVFTGSLLVLLASFLNYPTTSQDDTKTEMQKQVIVFPISEQIKIARIEKHISQKELSATARWLRLLRSKKSSGWL